MSDRDHVFEGDGFERLRRERAWSHARQEDPTLRLTLRASEVRRLIVSLRAEADHADMLGDDYERSEDYAEAVTEYRASAAVLRKRADELEARESSAIGVVYRRNLA